MNVELLIKEVARCALEHGYLHLGHCTLQEFIAEDLKVSQETLINLLKEIE
jgi:hypothetical protein